MSASLENLYKANEGMIQVAQNAQKRQKVNEGSGGKPYFETIAMKLWEQQRELRKNYDDVQLEVIEVEVRVGMIIDNYRRWKSRISTKSVAVVDPRGNASLRFRAGVDHVFAHKLRTKLAIFTAEPQPLQIMRCDGDDNRWTVGSDGSLLVAERKQALDQVNIALLAHDYDIRLNVATEIADPVVAGGSDASAPAGPAVNRDAWIVERRKKRTCYSIRDPQMSSWRIDYTEVDIIARNAGTGAGAGASKPKKEIELEFELERAVMLDWLRERDSAASVEKTRSLAQQLVRLLDFCLPFESEAEREASLVMVHDAHLEQEIASLNAQILGSGRAVDKRGKGGFDFLGAMPVNLTRQNLLEVQSSDYYVTEKSDGVRYLLYTVPESSRGGGLVAVLVDRSKAVFKFRGSEAVGRALGPGCVLDGELVYNRSFRENVFLVFDALLWRGGSLVAQPFGERLERITREVLPSYARGMQDYARQQAAASAAAGQPNLPSNPLQLVRKAFVPKKELGTLLAKMRNEDGERVFFDGEAGSQVQAQAQSRRHHKSDGLIFQPNAAYQSGRHYDLLKWKWPELRSVDLQVEIPMGAESVSAAGGGDWPIYLMCGGPDNTLINCTKRGETNVGLGEFDAYRLLADMESPEMAGKAGSAVVEVAYDIQIGLWAYLHLRKDKNQPNFIDSVLGVFTEQAEALSIEELQYSLAASAMGQRNDFEQRVGKMKEQLLAWQRSELARLSAPATAAANGVHSNGRK